MSNVFKLRVVFSRFCSCHLANVYSNLRMTAETGEMKALMFVGAQHEVPDTMQQ